ncbi:hypothetical protein LNV09_01100 [Paucibacter sp. B2R-40]|uniref:hypothetical protein n=1 Tax=Paucibacter sp. B2R-40 TaxID=2893554 RepID=UPI0021E39AAE|nr:hypothetical protein [Paucibacter sp. B2R-40]MCV2352751.1 hypothetical protein [Paucibacter sp. B2R-40]
MAQITAAAVVLDLENHKFGPAQSPAQLELGIEPVGIQDTREPSVLVPATQSVGFALGWDYAHHGLTPPALQLYANSPLRQGFQAGSATFGRRTLSAKRHTQQWLLLRTHAWSRGRSFEDVQLTPNYLQQIEVGFCPITRQPLDAHKASRNQAQIDRVRDDAGYAAGNLVMMSRAANLAKAHYGWQEAAEVARSVEAGPIHRIAGLGSSEWQRVALLCSFVTELPHEQAAALPLLVLPPNRLRLFNPIQALQAMLTRQLATPGWSARLARIEALLPSQACKADFNRFVLALAPRVLAVSNLHREQEIRWALEDAWQQPLLLKRWTRFALHLNAAQAEALLQRAAAKHLVNAVHVQHMSQPNAIDGWALERGGFCAVSQVQGH